MTSRGLNQLKVIKLVFSDWGGSSKGVLQFFKQDKFYEFVNQNENTHFKIYLKRNAHPFIRCEYVNGFMFDLPLLNDKPFEIYEKFLQVKNRFGARSMKHEGYKVSTVKPSIQGGWIANMWGNHPKHAMQFFKTMPTLQFNDLKSIARKNVKRKAKDILVSKLRRPKDTLNI